MADIIVRQANATSLTVQASSNQVIVRQQPNNTVVVQTTGNSYVLPPATANTLGGIIVGDNLTINANGLLSATAGAGVSTFNNRTGNVTLTANDVSAVANDLYAKESNQTRINLADGLATRPLFPDGPVITPSMQFYGITSNQPLTGYNQLSYVGLTKSGTGDYPYFGKWQKYANGTESQIQFSLELDARFSATTYLSNFTLVSDVYYLIQSSGFIMGASDVGFAEMQLTAAGGLQIFAVAYADNNPNPSPGELLNRSTADTLYEKITRRN
jgi:hypothetical protein